MGIMGFLRNRAGVIIVIAIGFAIVAFLLSDAIRSGKGFIADSQSEVGKVAGETISYKDFNDRVEQNSQQFKQQMGSLNAQMTGYVVENTWNQTVSGIILKKQTDKLGLSVGQTELFDLIFDNPTQQVKQIFTNPQTGQFDRATAVNSRKSADTDPSGQLKAQWVQLEDNVQQQRINEKYINLVKNGVYVNTLDAKDDYTNKNKLVNFEYAYTDYAAVPDAEVKVTDADYKEYYEQNKYKYKNPTETRTFEYVEFDAAPSAQDTAEAKVKIEKIAEGLKTTDNDSLFVAINSDTKTPLIYQKKGSLEPSLDSIIFNAAKGDVYGPFISNGSYKVAKLIDSRMSPDSVKARHILINPAAEGGLDKAQAKADSLKKLIQGGADFAALAAKYGTDGSKDKGGDLGTFARGSMIPAFEDAVFNGKSGQVLVVKTQYGVHVIEIEKQIGLSRVVKVAVVDKAIVPSSGTEQSAYQKAQSFLSGVSSVQQFEENAQKQGLNKKVGENVVPLQASLPGLDDSRKLIKWAFNADKGAVSNEIFDIGDKYVVAVLTTIKPEGTLSLEDVKKQIEPDVKRMVQGKILKTKFESALNGASSLAQVATKLGTQVVPVENIVFANPVIPGVAQENKVIGAIFGSQPNKLSKVINGDRGVYIYTVKSFTNPPALTNVLKVKEQMEQAISQQVDQAVFEVLKKKADIKDNRAKFY
ncbi:MAG: SurA N-terminal domain-containing protein [Bacteroidetes bacterium]|nr:SurA N-terminal domain-containing protein [Bacteroidota bacterium]MBU1371202.1 SurA N-terminal domain-containing protein [Bacteroidota bacterium]MBU1483779.1 SurA N-terminal domain-containing protein [Bacteroidota bacterium]MBU1760781.1 SurA N-terminal domain-containing protein [Bacteroidota bacterium]MBU2266741.1 SurA N-terminal domain-containing protein [Bacteroidota bacterium]